MPEGKPAVAWHPDGTEFISGPGDVLSIPSGNDGWVVGDEPVVVIDFHGASTYARAVERRSRAHERR